MTNVKVTKWKHGTNKNKMAPMFRTILGRNSLKKKKKETTKGPDMNFKYTGGGQKK
jgi:hypothetical protein